MKLSPPNNAKSVLLHCCCAPCAGSIALRLKKDNIACTLFYYNPNIYPVEEYNMRKQEQLRYAQKLGIPCIDADYDVNNWLDRVNGFENEPERGRRCKICFDVRLERTARYAHENGFPVFATTLGLSRWKDLDQVNACGREAASTYDDVIFWDHNWRKEGGSQQMYTVAKEEHFYKQEYCGCVYSLNETNARRMKNSQPEIQIKSQFYKN